MRAEWDEWNGIETRPQDHEGQEEIFHDPAEQSTMIVPTEDPVIERSGLQDRVFRSLIDLTPIQHQREVMTPTTTERRMAEAPPRHYVEGYAAAVWQFDISYDRSERY